MIDDFRKLAVALFAAVIKSPELVKALAQPGFEKAGKAIGEIVEIVSWPTARLAIFIRDNLARYQAKLDAVPLERIIAPVPEIAVPILERLGYIVDVNLAECLAALLAKASDQERAGSVHPTFVRIVECLVPDEVILLGRLTPDLVFTEITLKDLDGPALRVHLEFGVAPEVVTDLAYPAQLGVYIENLASLGIIRLDRQANIGSERKQTQYPIDEAIRRSILDTSEIDPRQIITSHAKAELTMLGRLFKIACDLEPSAPADTSSA